MIIHTTLVGERWNQRSTIEQMANIGCDVDRAIRWRNKGELVNSRNAFERALELLQFTIADPKNRKKLKELCRLKEVLVDYFAYDNEYVSTDEWFQDYFFNFNYMYALQKGK
ncbi:MAG TPA: hypothetical protein VHX42_00660 [Candidatus Babeliales bacterium]|jgi:hypothetical protein|nr:hypothetical protein [Candidatus Babeliales bacterium]